jgi:hypothetical protein
MHSEGQRLVNKKHSQLFLYFGLPNFVSKLCAFPGDEPLREISLLSAPPTLSQSHFIICWYYKHRNVHLQKCGNVSMPEFFNMSICLAC